MNGLPNLAEQISCASIRMRMKGYGIVKTSPSRKTGMIALHGSNEELQ